MMQIKSRQQRLAEQEAAKQSTKHSAKQSNIDRYIPKLIEECEGELDKSVPAHIVVGDYPKEVIDAVRQCYETESYTVTYWEDPDPSSFRGDKSSLTIS